MEESKEAENCRSMPESLTKPRRQEGEGQVDSKGRRGQGTERRIEEDRLVDKGMTN